MANLISHKANNVSHSINNSWTNVLYSTLLISGSNFAKTDWEKQFLIWSAEHDQEHIGLGLVGIDFDDIFWSKEDFEAQKSFVLDMAKRAISDNSWRRLDYKMNEEILRKNLQLWIDTFSNATIDDIQIDSNDFRWRRKPQALDLDRKCEEHNVFLNRLGQTNSECCYLCYKKL